MLRPALKQGVSPRSREFMSETSNIECRQDAVLRTSLDFGFWILDT